MYVRLRNGTVGHSSVRLGNYHSTARGPDSIFVLQTTDVPYGVHEWAGERAARGALRHAFALRNVPHI